MRAGLRNFLFILSLMAMLASACSHNPYLVPAPNAKVVPNQKDAAEAEAFGVHLVVNGNAWRGYPVDLADVISPVEASIQNHSGKPLSIRYKDFSLTNESGFQSSALPPYTMNGTTAQAYAPIVSPGFQFGSFWIAPYYYPVFGPDLDIWPGDFPYDPDYYQTYFGYWPGSLPTRSMLEQAIPEGVIGDGGHISGFLYFPRVKKEIRDVRFEFQLVDAKTKQEIGKIEIPLIRKQK
jgi:hypothetical protein